jgi:hypothetical protein
VLSAPDPGCSGQLCEPPAEAGGSPQVGQAAPDRDEGVRTPACPVRVGGEPCSRGRFEHLALAFADQDFRHPEHGVHLL